MFDVGFSEIVLIAVVCLIVIGPKRLPETVRFLGFWLGRIRRSLSNARADMEREFGLDEIRRELHNQEILQRLEDERKQVEQAFNKRNKTDKHTADRDPKLLEQQPAELDSQTQGSAETQSFEENPDFDFDLDSDSATHQQSSQQSGHASSDASRSTDNQNDQQSNQQTSPKTSHQTSKPAPITPVEGES